MRSGQQVTTTFLDEFNFISRTDSGVHVLRGPISVNTESWKYFADETPAIKAEIIGEMNNTLKEIHHDSLELLDLHRVSNGFSLRKNISYRQLF